VKRLLLGCSLLLLTLVGCAQNRYAASNQVMPAAYAEAPTAFAESSPRYEEVEAISMGGIGYGGAAPKAKLARGSADLGEVRSRLKRTSSSRQNDSHGLSFCYFTLKEF